MPATQPAPLSPDNLRALRQLLFRGRLEACLGFGGALALLAGSALLGVTLHERPAAGSDRLVLAAMLALVLLFAVLLLRRQAGRRAGLWRPLAETMAQGSKQVTHGPLHDLEAADGGGLRYAVDGEVLHLWPLAGPFDGPDLMPGQRFDRLSHLAGADVALHWLPLAPGQGLLLEAHGPEAPATRRSRPSEDADHRRAAWHARELILVLALALPAGTLPLAFAGGFDPGRLGLTLAIGLLTCGAIAVLGGLQVRRQRARGLRLTTLSGPVTECLRTPPGGRGRPARHWYRVGGMLVCPEGRRTAPVSVGQRVDVEFLAGDGGSQDMLLVAFGPSAEAPPPTAR